MNIALLPVKEVRKEHYTREYLRFCTLVRDRYLYRIHAPGDGSDSPSIPWGISAGVSYVAVFMARQLHKQGCQWMWPLIAGAAAVHDMGNTAVRREEKRVPTPSIIRTFSAEREGLPQMEIHCR